MVRFTRKSQLSGNEYTMELGVAQDALDAYLANTDFVTIQTALPGLSRAEREFVLTGVTPQEWNAVFVRSSAENNLMIKSGSSPGHSVPPASK
jgi:hypothetical protein